MPMTIVLADDHTLVREGLRALLDQEEGLCVVGEAADGRQVVGLVEQLKPDLVVMDVTMPHMGGIDATARVRAASRKTKVVALSMHADARFAQGMLRAGASGYVLKDCAFEELVEAIRAVERGGAYLSPQIASTTLEAWARGLDSAEKSALTQLTAREREVLQLLAEGRSTRDVAALLHLSTKTIETHRFKIMEKLGLRSVAELTKYAVREGLTPLE